MRSLVALLALAALVASSRVDAAPDVFDRVRHRYADSDGVRIHYATLGRGPLVVMIHGFPDFWYSWRDQMAGLARHYTVAAMDQRGYNLSDKPVGDEQYDLVRLVGDVAAVIRDMGRERAIVVGHDWGGAVAWTLAMLQPELVERLVVLNLPHPGCMLRELRENPAQLAASSYARTFQDTNVPYGTSAAVWGGLHEDPDVRARYTEAMAQSDLAALMAYYKRNYPREPYAEIPFPQITVPVLVIHGLDDPFLLADGLNGTWRWIDGPLTLVTIPGASHFVQWDASALVTKTLKQWLADARRGRR